MNDANDSKQNDRRQPQMNGHGEKLSRKKELAVTALLTEPSISGAASRVGIGESTIRRWLRDNDLRAAVEEVRRGIFRDAIGSLRVATTQAVETFRSALR